MEHKLHRHLHMSLSLMMPQKYCGFSTKLDKPESSSEEGGLVPKFMKRSETARSSSLPRTDEPNETQETSMADGYMTPNQSPTSFDCSSQQKKQFWPNFSLLKDKHTPLPTWRPSHWYHGDR